MEARYRKGSIVTVSFNHTIIFAEDKQESASFFTKLFALPEPGAWGPFLSAELDHGVFVQFAEPGIEIQAQHYAFLVTEDEFDGIYQRILDAGLPHWADPRMSRPGQYNTNHGGRGVYFRDPSGHNLEALTAPYA
jgi:catechol 2,3-dioxygenase-like lactoylglutathione lyase family enzyme